MCIDFVYVREGGADFILKSKTKKVETMIPVLKERKVRVCVCKTLVVMAGNRIISNFNVVYLSSHHFPTFYKNY